jgi:hypothetical protein
MVSGNQSEVTAITFLTVASPGFRGMKPSTTSYMTGTGRFRRAERQSPKGNTDDHIQPLYGSPYRDLFRKAAGRPLPTLVFHVVHSEQFLIQNQTAKN